MFRYTLRGTLPALLLVAFVNPVWSQEQQPPAEDPPGSDILELDIEQLGQVDVIAPSLDVEVTTVSRSESTVGKSPAAIFVITNEMIRRSGARQIPEVLRMVPGINVARISANKWAVSVRGFNSRFANKLLVQIDGRTVYTPLFAGVYWDVQDVVLEDVDRIEVIRGPGATVWGENAVNGIINIITKSSKDTQGLFFDNGAGDRWQGFSTLRLGGQVNDDLTYRVFGKWQERSNSPNDPAYTLGGPDDSTRLGHTGFRMDWNPDCCNQITFQGAYYDGFSGGNALSFNFPLPNTAANAGDTVRGGHLLYRWTHDVAEDTQWSLQMYYDRTERRGQNPQFTSQDRDLVDLDFAYRMPLGYNQQLIWGFGYRYTDDFVRNGANSVFNPNARALDTVSYFVQDRFTLLEDKLYFTAGSKFSHNDYTNFEMQPSLRLLWTPDERRTIWAAVSRAVRTPSRADTDLTISVPPVGALIVGNPFFEAEEVLSYEMGMRAQPVDEFFWDLALFYNDYTDLGDTFGLFPPFTRGNRQTHEQTWGFELANTVQVNPCWQVRSAYSFIRGSIDLGDDIFDVPRNQVYVQSSMDLGCNIQFDLIARYVDLLPGDPTRIIFDGTTTVPSYFETDVRVAWQPNETLEWYVVGRNLLDAAHPEATADPSGAIGGQVPREVYTGVAIRR